MVVHDGVSSDGSSSNEMPNPTILEYIFHHVFLPLKLPQEDDSDATNDLALIHETLSALRAFDGVQCKKFSGGTPLTRPIAMMENMINSRTTGGRLLAETAQTQMGIMKENDVLAFHLKAQNAALYIRRQNDQFIFETFEVSCPNASVTGTVGRIERTFPAEAMAISASRMLDKTFREPFAEMLASMDETTPPDAYRTSKKANQKVEEIRDAVNPRYFTEMTFGILRGIGEPADIPRVQKYVRDDVLWSRTFASWRRSPLWTVIRVALQTTLMRCIDPEQGYASYKAFMVYLMARLLCNASKNKNVSSEILRCMQNKVVRRLNKVQSGIDRNSASKDVSPWVKYVEKAVQDTTRVLEHRWHEIEGLADPFHTQNGWDPSALSFKDDTVIQIAGLEKYCSAIKSRQDDRTGHTAVNVEYFYRTALSTDLPNTRILAAKSGEALRVLLADIESWIYRLLPGWQSRNIGRGDACLEISAAIEEYTTSALRAYHEDPESLSIMFLTAMELWVCLDKVATNNEPLLMDYKIEFPPTLFDPLLLPKRYQMNRLQAIEQHVSSRGARCRRTYPSIFSSFGKQGSIAVRYFDQSPPHQQLRTKIEQAATQIREEKKRELARKKKEQAALVAKAAATTHTMYTESSWNKYTNTYTEEKRHSSDCQKCAWESEASKMQIDIHEWPLPSDQLQAKAVVFELSCPMVISVWRDSTYYTLVDLFTAARNKPRQVPSKGEYKLRSYAGLSSYFAARLSRIQLVSAVKPFPASHYRSKLLTIATTGNICVENALRYDIYDSENAKLAREFLGLCEIRAECAQQIPNGPYKCLQHTVDNTTHFPNQVIADQSVCPPELPIHEFMAFGHVRAGHHLQWQNIGLALRDGNINLNQEATRILLTQAAWQAGPTASESESALRDSHAVLENASFCSDILKSITSALIATKENWKGITSVQIFISLAHRIMSLSPHARIREECLEFISAAREITFSWTRKLIKSLRKCTDDSQRDFWMESALEVALSCYSTFAVDPHETPKLLASSDSVKVLTECAITIHDLCPAVTTGLPCNIQFMLIQYSRVAHSLEESLHEAITEDATGLDLSIQGLWASYRPRGQWKPVLDGQSEWLMTNTAGNDAAAAISVHYNLLTGSLLVDGSSLSRLPRAFEMDASYRRLFGSRSVNVVPSTMAGMRYESRDDQFGYQVFFAMQGSQLIIRATQNSRCFEVLPIEPLRGDFPPAFVDKYSHWLELTTNAVEFRPLDKPWETRSDNWYIRSFTSRDRTLAQGLIHHVDMHSCTAKAIHKIFRPVENAAHIHVSFTPDTEDLKVHLIRLKLDFFLNLQNDLECTQRRGMVVDRIQSCGTFTGLRNKLLLRPLKEASRCIIIPSGTIQSQINGHHVEVGINTGIAEDVAYFYYELDALLWRLTDNGSLTSCLFRTLIHAYTSHCLTDQFTGLTGTEQAMYNLREASTHSFRHLDPKDIQILETIAGLTPRRFYYPRERRLMQQVEWNHGLPSLSQHESFSTLVFEIFQRARDHRILCQPVDIPDKKKFGESALLKKSIIRNSVFRVPGFGAEDYTTSQDAAYIQGSKTQEKEVCSISRLTDEWSVNLHVTTSLLHDIEGWRMPVQGISCINSNLLGYDKSWLGAIDDLPRLWCSIIEIVSRTDKTYQKYRLMMFLSTLFYSGAVDSRVLRLVLGFATVPALRTLPMPQYTEYKLSEGYEPKEPELLTTILGKAKTFSSCPESKLPQLKNEVSQHQVHARRTSLHKQAKEQCAKDLVKYFMSQWPSPTVRKGTEARFETYFNITAILTSVAAKFQSWFRNREFKAFIERVQEVLNRLTPTSDVVGVYIVPQHVAFNRLHDRRADWDWLFDRAPPDVLPVENFRFQQFLQDSIATKDYHKTQDLLHRMFSTCNGHHERLYCEDMLKSLKSLQKAQKEKRLMSNPDGSLRTALRKISRRYKAHALSIYERVHNSFSLNASTAKIVAHQASFSPRLSPIALLRHLACSEAISTEWKTLIVQYGKCLAKFQYCKRLLTTSETSPEFLKELVNVGHVGWDPLEHPEWLAFEVENNLLIRPNQAQVAKQMLFSSSSGNRVMQLNMGEGKSSVIVPIIAATLAKGERLPRVIVLPALTTQMFHILRQKLGGMLNRRVVVMPFSRSFQLSNDEANEIYRLYQSLLQDKCVVLCQPEHILSFDLMSIEKSLSDEHTKLGSTLVETQKWIDRTSRDVLDESDEILNVKFELIYTIGLQAGIDFGPDRWTIITDVLGSLMHCLKSNICQLQESFPDGLQMHWSDTGFPRIQVLQQEAGAMLLRLVVEEITTGGLPGFPIWTYEAGDRSALLNYITSPRQPEPLSSTGLRSVFESTQKRLTLLLLRGLFAHGVLLFAFQHKRWRVNYGHDLSRSMLAVPYRAKDLPALRAEFSHPDVTVILTCLSYYYSGLSDDQMFLCFEELLASDDPEGEYGPWVSNIAEVPKAFQTLSGVNLRDRPQCVDGLFPLIRYSKVVIDFYMTHLVFPKEMKEFPEKLSSSGWDIARIKSHTTTGFSGTNDSRYLLPLTVKQADIPDQVHTNATVLDCLLQPRNTYQVIPMSGETSSLLDLVVGSAPAIRVILDVGALVLEWRNDEMARRWLERVSTSEVDGVVYFDDHDEILVLTRDGRHQPLQESPLQKQMDRCLVYLDEAHTRGTDLKLPSDYRAAATLGIGLTKDRLVQACMRMRKLAHGQSVMLCAPPEIHRKIAEHVAKPGNEPIAVEDVLLWSMANTHEYTRKCVPLWATQGMRHQKRILAWNGKGKLSSILEPEAKSLQDWYGIQDHQDSTTWMHRYGEDVFLERQDEVKAIQTKMADFGATSIDDAALHEEQERELSPESEMERQLERPPKRKPAKHSLNQELRRMIKQGWLDPKSPAFVSAFRSLHNTTAASSFHLPAWPSGLLVTEDFARTVQAAHWEKQNEFIRPVRWILCGPKPGTSVIISPFEANELYPYIRSSDKIALHAYSPRTRESMQPLDGLDFCVVSSEKALKTPPDLLFRIQLNLFAGQLYFRDRNDYVSVCRFLGVASHAPGKGIMVSTDGFVNVEHRERFDGDMARACTMIQSPIDMLRALTDFRRNGIGLGKTHLGKLLGGELIKDRDFFIETNGGASNRG